MEDGSAVMIGGGGGALCEPIACHNVLRRDRRAVRKQKPLFKHSVQRVPVVDAFAQKRFGLELLVENEHTLIERFAHDATMEVLVMG